MLLSVIILNYLISVSDLIVIQSKGPHHKNMAVKCLEQVAKHAYNFTKLNKIYSTEFLLAYIINDKLSMPGVEIQEKLLKLLHKQAKYTIEVLQYDRVDFRSYSSNCPNDESYDDLASPGSVNQPSDCIRKHVKQLKSNLYIMVIDDVDMLKSKMGFIANTSSFNRDALYIIYFSSSTNNNQFVSEKIMHFLYKKMDIRYMVVMMSKNLTSFVTYILKTENKSGRKCFSESTYKTRPSYQCSNGILATNNTNIFKANELMNYFQCYAYVHAVPYEPFVISETSGIETDVINEIGKVLNISFQIDLYPNASLDLGEKSYNGDWSGFLEPIYHSWHLGIGNIPPETEYMEDFTFTVDYIRAKIVYVVPIASLVPSWRIFMVIFSIEMWGVCVLSIIGFAAAFVVFRTRKDAQCFKTIEKCVGAAFQVLIAHPLDKQPQSDFTRIYFIAVAILAIVLNSVYTSSLIYYLQNPIREHQISTDEEIANHLPLGSSPKYKEMFKGSSNTFAKIIYNSYITINESLDTNSYWIGKVGNERNMCTLGLEINVNYLISKKNRLVTDKYGKSKVFVLKKPLRSQPVGIIMRKGNFFLDNVNRVLQRLMIEAGIIEKIKNKYLQSTINFLADSEMSDSDDNRHGSNNYGQSALSTHHLEGAFAILAIGEFCSFFIFLLEFGYYRVLVKSNK